MRGTMSAFAFNQPLSNCVTHLNLIHAEPGLHLRDIRARLDLDQNLCGKGIHYQLVQDFN